MKELHKSVKGVKEMVVNQKFPDRLSTTKKAKLIIDKIDQKKYLGLESSSTTRSELFSFAMSLGIESVRTKLDNINPGGLVLDPSIDSRTKSIIYAFYIYNLSSNSNLDEVTNKENVYNMAQEYANTGFENLDDYILTKKDSDLIWDLLGELDNQFDINVKSDIEIEE
jgi:hypothetical protein